MSRKIKYRVFLAVFFAVFLAVLFIRPSKAFLFQNAMGDCAGRGAFMYNALYRDNKQAEVVLFGSSKTMNDINDSLMTSISKTRFLNLGYCRFGRNLDYFFIEEYCNTHNPAGIVLEVREEEGSGTHPLTAFLMPVSKIAEDMMSLRSEVFQNLYNKWLCNLKFLRGVLFSNLPAVPAKVSTDHGFWYGNKKTETEPLIEKRYRDSVELKRKNMDSGSLNRNSRYYFEKLKNLCAQKKINLYFLYLPAYGNVYRTPLKLDAYRSYGDVFLPPDSISKNVLNYSDYGHLNKRGADLISLWLLEQFDSKCSRSGH